MGDLGQKQVDYIKNYIIKNLDKLEKSNNPYYNYMIKIGNNYTYLKIGKYIIRFVNKHMRVKTDDIDFVFSVKHRKMIIIYNKIKSFIKKMIGKESK